MAFDVRRIFKLAVFFLLLAMLLITRLIYLQIVKSNELALDALVSRVQELPISVGRGDILDAKGKPLTNSSTEYSIFIFPDQIVDIEENCKTLSSLVGLPYNFTYEKIIHAKRPFKLISAVKDDVATLLRQRHLPGVVIVAQKVRYNNHGLAAHVLGYINAADNQGVAGIESLYDDLLKDGNPLYVAAMVDAGQQLIPGLGYKMLKLDRGVSATNVMLTIDSDIQQKVEKVMDLNIKKGAVVVMNPYNGEIMAMASRPNFNGNDLPGYLGDTSAPLMNRAISSYQPGSVFKLVVACAAIEHKIVTPDDVFFDKGYIDVNNLRFKGWDFQNGERGWITFSEALAYSSNPVIIQVGLNLGASRLISLADKLGFGKKTNLAFPGEQSGILPNAENLYEGDLANLSIGQGKIEATPLQLATMVSTIVNDGIKVTPLLVKALVSKDNTIIKNYNTKNNEKVFSASTAKALQKMMRLAIEVGTGKLAEVADVGCAGKTGTAETGRFTADGTSINHAWFAGYAPYTKPKYVIVVFVEDGMSGGDMAAPVFGEIVKELFN